MYCCHRVSTQLLLNIYIISYIISCTRPVLIRKASAEQASESIRSSSGLQLTLVAEHLTVGPVTGTSKEGITPILILVDP
jgi:hypothetical protein